MRSNWGKCHRSNAIGMPLRFPSQIPPGPFTFDAGNYNSFSGLDAAGGGFCLGSGGDKGDRKIVRVRRKGASTSDVSSLSCPVPADSHQHDHFSRSKTLSSTTSKNPFPSATTTPGERSTDPYKNAFTFATATTGERNADPNKDQTVEQVISLKVVIEKKNKKVLFVECNKDFVDVIFGFLTLPIGSILRLLEGILPPVAIGCLSNIYGSVGNLNIRQFKTEACKQMLLRPRISSKAYLKNLKLKIEDGKAECFYFCQNEACRKEGKARLSEFLCFHCHCGRVMDQKATLVEPVENAIADDKGGVFIREATEVFLLGDDMQVMPGVASIGMLLLKQFGIREVNELEIRHVDVGNKQILKLLWLILVSKTPLTNWILEGSISLLAKFEPQNIIEPVNKRCALEISKRMSLTLIFCKSMRKVLFAECREEFVDFLVSFLTFPLGSVSKVLEGKSQVVCLDNIYKSVGDLSAHGYFKSEEAKNMLFCPRLPPHVAYKNNLLQIEETLYPPYLLLCAGGSKQEWFVYPVHSASSDVIIGERTELVSAVVNPKSCDGKAACNGGFIKGPATFMITDELVVMLLSPASSISFIGELNVAITDIDEVTVEVGEEEAKNLLRASLLSKTALTDVFSRTCLDRLESKNLGEDLETLEI